MYACMMIVHEAVLNDAECMHLAEHYSYNDTAIYIVLTRFVDLLYSYTII